MTHPSAGMHAAVRPAHGVGWWAGIALLAFVVAGVVLVRPGDPAVAPAHEQALLPGSGVIGQRGPSGTAHAVWPVRLEIPRIDVATRLMRLGLTADHELQVPPLSQAGTAGWYDRGPVPGQTGPAVLAGHVDSETGPAVFYGLSALHRGDTVAVERSDRRTAVFSVDRVAAFAKRTFPTRVVYGATHDAELRLITCGGSYDPARGGYQSNVVVFAHLDRLKRTPGEEQ
jgi:sortase (surface protein transpeptidase)